MAEMSWTVTIGDRSFELVLSEDENGVRLLSPSDEGGIEGLVPVDLQHIHGSRFLLSLGDRTMPVFIDRWNGSYRVVVGGHQFSADVEDSNLHRLRAEVAGLRGEGGPAEIVAPMPGLVLSLEVGEGDSVSKGQGVVVIESMKMENEIRAGVDGVVKKLLVTPGTAVDKGQKLLELAPAETA